jgi:DNA-binding MarR family transcriptional regulator
MFFVTEVFFQTTLFMRETYLCLHVQRAARALARRFDEALRPLDLTNGQFSLLMSLDRPHAPRISAVAELLAIDRTTLTAALKPLERRRLVVVKLDPADHRGRRLILTPAGRKLLAKAAPIWKKHHRGVEALLDDPAQLRVQLRALCEPAKPLPVKARPDGLRETKQ